MSETSDHIDSNGPTVLRKWPLLITGADGRSGRLIQTVNALQCSVTDLIGSGNDGPTKSTEFSRYASSKEGVAIINAMAKIPSPAIRRQMINHAESLAASLTPNAQ